MEKNEIRQMYSSVGEALSDALKRAKSVELRGDEENFELKNIQNVLNEVSESFKKEISELKKTSEWEKFCISFFGETNAGKSTIIESLRIVYGENARQKELESQEKELHCAQDKCRDEYERTLKKYRQLVEEAKNFDVKKCDKLLKELKYLTEMLRPNPPSKLTKLHFVFLALGFFAGGTFMYFLCKLFAIWTMN